MDGNAQLNIADNLVNLTTGLGTSKDRSTQAQFTPRAKLPRSVLDSLYAVSWLGGKVVDVPAETAASREWRQWNGSRAQIQAMETEEDRLRVRAAVTSALKFAAKDGGSAILLGAGGDPATELDIASIPKGGLQFIHVVSRWDLAVTEMNRDPMSPYYGQAREYRIYSGDGAYTAIHPSRVVPFIGIPRADAYREQDPWGDSVYERLHDPIRDTIAAMQTAASLLSEAKVDVIQIKGLSEGVVRADYRNAVMQRFGLAMALKSVHNSIVLDAEETWTQKQLTFQGIPDIIDRLQQAVAGAVNVPVSILFGRSAAGLNATGQADLESFYTYIKNVQQTMLRPALERLDAALIRSATGRSAPRNLFYEWRTLWSPAATDLADVNYKHAQAVEAYSRSGIFTPEALQSASINQLSEDNFLSGIDLAIQTAPGAPGNVQVQTTRMATEAKAAEAAAAPAPTPAARRPQAPKPTD
jgi:phage-related protein (TIGR01555 family)